ncbi:hypothetical protein [Dysosmobacter sp.]|jgi:hypothetical protein|uniref:hypothetical protein n=1 Tax=Dysosmobacter sp. TaxID=2591382 RepID=UPI003D8F2F01
MQDRYAGDIGDFAKFGLLKALLAEGFSLGVNWYHADPPENERDKGTGDFLHEDGRHPIDLKYFMCDEPLAKALRKIAESDARSIAQLEEAVLLNPTKTVYYDEVISVSGRSQWHKDALQALASCELVFLDPDTGLNVKSYGKGAAKSVKYVWDHELSDYLCRGQSVVLYQHRQHKALEVYFSEFRQRFLAMEGVAHKPVFVLTCPKGTVRDYFLFAANEEHAARISSALRKMVEGPWGKSGLCELQNFEI